MSSWLLFNKFIISTWRIHDFSSVLCQSLLLFSLFQNSNLSFSIDNQWIQRRCLSNFCIFLLLLFCAHSSHSNKTCDAKIIMAFYSLRLVQSRRNWTIENSSLITNVIIVNGYKTERVCELVLFFVLFCSTSTVVSTTFLWIFMNWSFFSLPFIEFLCTYITRFRLKYELSWYSAFIGIHSI